MPDKIEEIISDRLLTIETGKLAVQANGAVTVRYGDTIVLVTACTSKQPREGIDFLPLTIDYEERLYAAGKIPGGFFRREGRPTQEATLAARLTDRPLRPLFPKGFRYEVQIVTTVLSADQENSPEVLSIIGASSALTISDIPFNGPLGAVRIGYLDGEFIINPTFSQLQRSLLDLVVVSTSEAVVMIEGGGKEVDQEIILEAIDLAHEVNQRIIGLQRQLQEKCGLPKMEFEVAEINHELEKTVEVFLNGRIAAALGKDKVEREVSLTALKQELLNELGEKFPPQEVTTLFEARLKEALRSRILVEGIRPDGRRATEIRPISCEVGPLPRTHGSGLFIRGLTHVLTITTLGSLREEQTLEGLSLDESKRFIHHYNFPPFSTGEVKRLGSPGRREIGHGALAERALASVIPAEEDFPYTIRLVSEVLSSNGSTSMASVCGSTLALMDAGVPIKAPVVGVAMGLVNGEDSKYVVLTDIEGIEDANGDMDFKVAGTANGITALQLDIKVSGLSREIIAQAFTQARQAHLIILEKMQQTIATSRPELSHYAPRILKMNVEPDKIGLVIGQGGRTIKSIIEETKTTINIENDGTVFIGSLDEESAQRAKGKIESLVREAKVGEIYTGRVTRLFSYGALVEIFPGKEGLVHISELADYHVPSVEDVVKIGDEITVMVIRIEPDGKISLSHRAVLRGLPQVSARAGSSTISKHPPRRYQNGSPSFSTAKGSSDERKTLPFSKRTHI